MTVIIDPKLRASVALVESLIDERYFLSDGEWSWTTGDGVVFFFSYGYGTFRYRNTKSEQGEIKKTDIVMALRDAVHILSEEEMEIDRLWTGR